MPFASGNLMSISFAVDCSSFMHPFTVVGNLLVDFVILYDVLNFPRAIHKDLKKMLIVLSLTL